MALECTAKCQHFLDHRQDTLQPIPNLPKNIYLQTSLHLPAVFNLKIRENYLLEFSSVIVFFVFKMTSTCDRIKIFCMPLFPAFQNCSKIFLQSPSENSLQCFFLFFLQLSFQHKSHIFLLFFCTNVHCPFTNFLPIYSFPRDCFFFSIFCCHFSG